LITSPHANTGSIDYFQLRNPLTRLKSIISNKARKKMYRHFIDLIKPTEKCKVLDMGVTPNTSLIESNFFEKMYPFTHNITMSSIEDASNLEEIFKGAIFIKCTANEKFPFNDKQFDIMFCSAVLEHVGDDDEQRYFIKECLRVAKKIYLTTPNKYFPVEFHTYLPFIHFLPQRIHQKILRKLKLDFWAETRNLNLLTRKNLYAMIPDEVRNKVMIHYNRLFGIPANLILFVDE
jgi:2-polyprenyl-3-methyl-5-hydroxy-6-metoxy-1,4-benzoquinol methylase